MAVELLHYRPWRGQLRPPVASVWPIARLSMAMLFRRKMLWALYGLALISFCLFFFGQYMLSWAESQMGYGNTFRFLGRDVKPEQFIGFLRKTLKLDGTAETYRSFIAYQGYMVMAILALAGSVLVGNDFRHGSLPFYLSKPIATRHYLLGKCLAIAVFINLLTTIPAIALYLQYGFLNTYDYFRTDGHLLLGILGFGVVLTVVLGLVLMATAVLVRQTVPLIMAWTTLFFFLRVIPAFLVERLHLDRHWKLIDLWNNMMIVGNACLGGETKTLGQQPSVLSAFLVLVAVSLLCLTYSIRRIRAVEIVQ